MTTPIETKITQQPNGLYKFEWGDDDTGGYVENLTLTVASDLQASIDDEDFVEKVRRAHKPKWYFYYHPHDWTWQIWAGKVPEMSNDYIVFNIRLGIIDFGYAY